MNYSIIQVNSIKLNNLYTNRPDSYKDYETKVNAIFEKKDKIVGLLEDGELTYSMTDEADFIIMSLPMQVLKNHFFYVALANSRFRKFKKTYNPKPIIFITAFNFFFDFHNDPEKPLNTKDFYENRKEGLLKRKEYFNLDKRYGFLDSSIWHFYVPYQDYKHYKKYYSRESNFKIVDFSARLNQAINVIKNNKDLDLYEALVSKENLEFQVRLMKNSYLDDIGGDHSKHITPFIFHSEGEMYHRTNYSWDKLIAKYGLSKDNEIKWNVLILDDYATLALKGTSNKSKKDILESFLPEDTGISIELDTISTEKNKNLIDVFLEALDSKHYDIILLDYLLDDDSNNQRVLGSEIFTNPKYREELIKKDKDLLGKYWFLPISSFNRAMLDRITNEGISRVSEKWYLFDGADIISTPELFKYNFIKLLRLQLEQAIVSKAEIIKFVMDNKVDNKENIRIRAKRLYGIFMHKFGMREALKADTSNGSVFAKSVGAYMDKHHFEDLDFYENVRKLLYLIGYGTHYDAKKMWHIYKHIFSKMNNAQRKEIVEFLDGVSEYINRLTK